jgi:hypothetical protein
MRLDRPEAPLGPRLAERQSPRLHLARGYYLCWPTSNAAIPELLEQETERTWFLLGLDPRWS